MASEWEHLQDHIPVVRAALNEYDWASERDTSSVWTTLENVWGHCLPSLLAPSFGRRSRRGLSASIQQSYAAAPSVLELRPLDRHRYFGPADQTAGSPVRTYVTFTVSSFQSCL